MIQIIGLGPGEESQITKKALDALKNCDVVAGYTVYIDLIKHLIKDKEIISTPMLKEVTRCKEAAKEAAKGKNVCVVSSGDAGIYGMAALVIEVCYELKINTEIKVIAGITAASSASAVLGAPLTHDFAVVSLSNLLTSWEDIEKRLDLASKAGFVIAIYNPTSKKRKDFVAKACNILLGNLEETTMCGYVKNIGRENESYKILTLKELQTEQLDMFTTIIIGNKTTKKVGNLLITPRGYRLEDE